MRLLALFAKIAVLAALVVLSAFNTSAVSFVWLPGSTISLPLIVLLLIFFVAGSVFGVFAMFGRMLYLRHENNRLREEVRKHAKAPVLVHDSAASEGTAGRE